MAGLGRTTSLKIRTPDGVTFSLPLAGPLTRFFAWMIDFLIIGGINIAINLLIGVIVVVSRDVAIALQVLVFMVLSLCYGMFFEWVWRGQTLGKKVLSLRVVDETGRGLLPVQIVIRNLLRAVDLLPFGYGIGGIALVLTQRCQRLGDLAAGTVVVRRVRLGSPDIEELLAGKYNSFRDHPVIEARLRQRVSPEEAKVCLSALLRRNSLDPDARLKVYGELADHFRSIAEFPETTTYGLTDEQFLRNTAESLFRKRPRGKMERKVEPVSAGDEVEV